MVVQNKKNHIIDN